MGKIKKIRKRWYLIGGTRYTILPGNILRYCMLPCLPKTINFGSKNILLVFNVKKFALRFVLLLILCSVLVSLPEINIVRASETIYIRADGSVEGTDKIQRNGNVYSFTGDISDSIVIEKDDIVLDGKEYALRGEGGGAKGISLDGRNNVTIKNLQVRDFDTCIFLDNSSNNEISGNTLVSTLGWGTTWIIQLKSFSNNNLISGNTIRLESEWEDHAIDIRKSSYNTIVGNNITSNMYCIGLDNYTNHTTITGNTLTSTNNWGWVNVWGKYNITFTNNILIRCSLNLYRSSHNTIEDNLVNNKPLVYLEDVSDQTVDYGGQVILVNCNNMRVENLDLSDITKGGVQLLYTNNTEISNYIGSLFFETSCHNRIIGSNCVELSFYRSSYNIITGNTITNSRGHGFMLESSNNNNIYANNITANRYSGIKLYNALQGSHYSCFNNSIHGNNISKNAEGIILKYCVKTTNIIYENNITNNHNAGVFVDGSYGNILYSNNFVDNNRHVMGWDSTNVWDNGSEGNYWDDYNGMDTNHDGIGDSPYSIHINSHFPPGDIIDYDNYPLMTEFIIPEFPSWTPILLILIVLTVATAIYKRRLLKTPSR